jgi:hypothetical protein
MHGQTQIKFTGFIRSKYFKHYEKREVQLMIKFESQIKRTVCNEATREMYPEGTSETLRIFASRIVLRGSYQAMNHGHNFRCC